jgi:MFS transporter, DHA1 family, L-arabinose/isopropyl-beta-D-thiogalactopyranoside export protein
MMAGGRKATLWPLLTLAFGAFVAQTTEYLPIGLLPQIGGAFAVPEGFVGALVTGYAWIAAATAIPLTLATGAMGRRHLFLLLLAILTLANALAAFAQGYVALAVCRVAVALTHGVFWSILASFAVRVAPHMPPGRAAAWVFSGISAAIVGGVPLAAAIGQWGNWRLAFGAFALLGALALLLGRTVLPPLLSETGRRTVRLPRGNKRLYGAAAITTLGLTAHFSGYTYVVPLLTGPGHVAAAALPALLVTFGVAGAAGNALAGWLAGRAIKTVALALSCVVGAQVLIYFSASMSAFVWIALALWGSAISMLIVGLQSWVLELASTDEADAASALYVAAFNVGIGAGALAGGLALAGAGAQGVLATSAAIGVLALVGLAVVAGLPRADYSDA